MSLVELVLDQFQLPIWRNFEFFEKNGVFQFFEKLGCPSSRLGKYQVLRQADEKSLQIWSVALTTLLDIPLVPGQDTYKDSGNAKIFDFFEKVPEL